MLLFRILLVVGFLLVVALATRLYRARQAAALHERPRHPLVPAGLRADAERTWVVFTTPYCATCGPVEDHLRAADPDARVVRVDATPEELAAADAVVLLADHDVFDLDAIATHSRCVLDTRHRVPPGAQVEYL